MPFGAHETMEAHEILNEKTNLINHFSWYLHECRDAQLKELLHRHLQTAIQAYNQLVSYTHDSQAVHGIGAQSASFGGNSQMQGISSTHIQYGLDNPAQQIPQANGRWNDQQIASAVLSFHKNSAKNHIMAAVECADANVRQLMINGAVLCANQAYEIFVHMNRMGWYQVPTMKDHTAKTYLHSYQPMQQAITQ